MRADELPPLLSNLSTIAGRYQGVILDLWGVVHDGQAAHPGAIAALKALRARGITICLLSNSPRRAGAVAARLAEMGVDPGLYDHLLTSGEMTFDALRDPDDAWHAALGRNYLHLGPPALAGLLEGTERAEVQQPGRADFVLATGTDGHQTVDDFLPVLQDCSSRGLPMICANPDLVVFVGEKLTVCAGSLAGRYGSLGGTVHYHGKPHSGAYRRALVALDMDRRSVLSVGDSMITDVAGAVTAGIDIAFVAGGIHRSELCVEFGELPAAEFLDLMLLRYQYRPTFVLSHFDW